MTKILKIIFVIIVVLLVLDFYDLYGVITQPDKYPFGENDFGLFNSNRFSYNTSGNYILTLCLGLVIEIIALGLILKSNFRKYSIYYVLGFAILIVKVIL